MKHIIITLIALCIIGGRSLGQESTDTSSNVDSRTIFDRAPHITEDSLLRWYSDLNMKGVTLSMTEERKNINKALAILQKEHFPIEEKQFLMIQAANSNEGLPAVDKANALYYIRWAILSSHPKCRDQLLSELTESKLLWRQLATSIVNYGKE